MATSYHLPKSMDIGQIDLERANGVSIQVAAKRIGIGELGKQYRQAIISQTPTKEDIELLREALKNAGVATVPLHPRRNKSGEYPSVDVVFNT